MNIFFRMALLASILGLPAACQVKGRPTPNNELAGVEVPLNQMNADIIVTAPADANSFTIGEPVTVLLENISSVPVEVSPDKDIMIFEENASQWVEIENLMDYSSMRDLIPGKNDELPSWSLYQVVPNFVKPTSVKRTRIVVMGTKDPDTSHSRVGAYVDLTLQEINQSIELTRMRGFAKPSLICVDPC